MTEVSLALSCASDGDHLQMNNNTLNGSKAPPNASMLSGTIPPLTTNRGLIPAQEEKVWPSQKMSDDDGSIQRSMSCSSSDSQISLEKGTEVIRRSKKKTKMKNGGVTDGHSETDISEVEKEAELIRRRSASILEVKEHAHSRLKEELFKAQTELKLKDDECKKLSKVHEQMSEELEDLTAKLFEEANKMVQDANVKRMNSEKLLKEAKAKIEVLQAEVTALKALVITSTPSMPNRHLHPQLEAARKQAAFVKGHRRSTSHHNFSKDITGWEPVDMTASAQELPPATDAREVDPVFLEEFKSWCCTPTLKRGTTFFDRVLREDVSPCITFPDADLSNSIFKCVMTNTLTMEPVPEKHPFPRKCALTQTMRPCTFKIKLGDCDTQYFVCQIARNRITTVGDFITYLRYITQGLVKSDEMNMYWEVARLRKEMCLSRLGLS